MVLFDVSDETMSDEMTTETDESPTPLTDAEPIEPNDTEKPSRTMPTRRSFLVTRANDAVPLRGRTPMLAATTPRPIAQVSTPTAGTNR